MFRKIELFNYVTLAVIFASIALTGCAAKKSAWGDPQTGLVLQYKLEQGQALHYRTSSESTQSMEMMGQSMLTTSTTGTDYIIKGEGMDAEDNIITQVIINDLSIHTTGPQGSVNPDTSVIKGKSFGIRFSPKGKDIKFTGINELPPISAGQPNAPAQSVKNYFSNLLQELPADNLKIGDMWTTPIDKSRKQGPIELTIKGETTSILDGLETIHGMESVRIKYETKSTVLGSGTAMGEDIKITGDITAISTWYFAYKKGMFIRGTVEETSNMKINMGAMGDMPQTTKVKTTVELVQ